MLQAMAGGAVDIGSVGNAPPVFAAAWDNVAIVGAFQANPHGSALLVPKSSAIHTIAQLKGKRIAVAQGSSADYHLLTVLNKAGLSVHDVTLVYLQPAEGRAALASGHVDAWDIWSPFVEQAQAADHARELVSGVGYGSPYSFTVASRGALAGPAKAAAIRDYLRLLAQAHAWAATHQAAWAAVSAKATGLPSAVMTQAAKDDFATAVPITPGGDQLRAVGLERAHVCRADPRARGLHQVRGHLVQQHRRGGLTSLTFHWFLPTTGDGRSIMGRGHSLPPASRGGGPGWRPATDARTSAGQPPRSGHRTSSTWPRWPGPRNSSASRRC